MVEQNFKKVAIIIITIIKQSPCTVSPDWAMREPRQLTGDSLSYLDMVERAGTGMGCHSFVMLLSCY